MKLIMYFSLLGLPLLNMTTNLRLHHLKLLDHLEFMASPKRPVPTLWSRSSEKPKARRFMANAQTEKP